MFSTSETSRERPMAIHQVCSKCAKPLYERTRFLLFHWTDERQYTIELEELRDELNRRPGFEGEIYLIPTSDVQYDSSQSVRQRIEVFKSLSDKDNELLLVVYGGHGLCVPLPHENATSRRCRWVSETGHFVEWYQIQEGLLLPAGMNTLLLLDCCSAGAPDQAASQARKDFLGACSKNKGIPRHSFTERVHQALRNWPQELITQGLRDGTNALQLQTDPAPYYAPRPSYSDREIGACAKSPVTRQPQPAVGIGVANRRRQQARGTGETETRSEPDHSKFVFPSESKEKGTEAIPPAMKVGADPPVSRTSQSPPVDPRTPIFTLFQPGCVVAVSWLSETISAGITTTPGAAAVDCPERKFIVVDSGDISCCAVPLRPIGRQPSPTEGVVSVITGTTQRVQVSNSRLPVAIRISIDDSMADSSDMYADYSKVSKIAYDVSARKCGHVHFDDWSAFLDNLGCVDSNGPINGPSYRPRDRPSYHFSYRLSYYVSDRPSDRPRDRPSKAPSKAPIDNPDNNPKNGPSDRPSKNPSSGSGNIPSTSRRNGDPSIDRKPTQTENVADPSTTPSSNHETFYSKNTGDAYQAFLNATTPEQVTQACEKLTVTIAQANLPMPPTITAERAAKLAASPGLRCIYVANLKGQLGGVMYERQQQPKQDSNNDNSESEDKQQSEQDSDDDTSESEEKKEVKPPPKKASSSSHPPGHSKPRGLFNKGSKSKKK